MKSIILPVSQVAMNLASVLEPATVGWNRHLYAIVPPASQIQMPPNERLILGHVAQSELAYACAMRASKVGRFSRRDIIAITVNDRGGAHWEFRSRDCAPEIQTIIARLIEELQGMLEAIVVKLVWACV